MKLREIREKYPQYNDLSDGELTRGLHKKHYSDMPFEEFAQRVGFAPPKPEPKQEETGFLDRTRGWLDENLSGPEGRPRPESLAAERFGPGAVREPPPVQASERSSPAQTPDTTGGDVPPGYTPEQWAANRAFDESGESGTPEPEMRAWEPNLWQRIQGALNEPSRARAMNEWAAREIVEDQKIQRRPSEDVSITITQDPRDIYRAAGGRQPLDPEGEGLVRAAAKRLPHAAGSAARGSAGMLAAQLRDISLTDDKTARALAEALPEFDRIDQGEEPGWRAGPFELNYYRADPAERQKMRANAKAYLETNDPTQGALYQAADWLDSFVRENTPDDPEYRGEFMTDTVPGAAGSMLTFVLETLATRRPAARLTGASPAVSGALTAGAAGGAAESGMGFQEALRESGSLEDAFRMRDLSRYGGWTEAAPIVQILDRADKATGGSIRRTLTDMVKSGGEEAFQEGIQNLWSNLLASKVVKFDPERGILEGTGEGAAAGFTVGSLMQLLGSAIGGRRTRSASQEAGGERTATQPEEGPADPDIPLRQAMRGDPLSPEDRQTLIDNGYVRPTDSGGVMLLPRARRRVKQIVDEEGEAATQPQEVQPGAGQAPADQGREAGAQAAPQPWQLPRRDFYANPDNAGADHEQAVAEALAAGERVPPEVLVDYPELIEEAEYAQQDTQAAADDARGREQPEVRPQGRDTAAGGEEVSPGGQAQAEVAARARQAAQDTVAQEQSERRSVTTGRGDKVDVQGQFVEADDLIASHTAAGNVNPAFPEALQPRDRSRQSSQAQIARMARSIDPELLDDTAKASDGAPIVGPDNVVESGNARTAAIRQAYDEGAADRYRQFVERKAQRAGVDISNMQRPVYVRRRATDMDETQRAEFARQANQSDLSSMSPTEQARADAERLSPADLSAFDPDESGNVLAASNDAFLRRFAENIGEDEAAALRTGDGRWNKRMADRVQGAVFAKAYGDERLLSLAAEEADPGVKNILTGLQRAAPAFARARDEDGSLGDYDTASVIVDAIEKVREARSRDQNLDEMLRQGDAFADTPETVAEWARTINDNIRSGKQLGNFFRNIGELTEAYANQRSEALFGDEVSVDDILQAARTRTEVESGDRQVQFSRPEDEARGRDPRGRPDQDQRREPERAPDQEAEAAAPETGEVDRRETARHAEGMRDTGRGGRSDSKPQPQERPSGQVDTDLSEFRDWFADSVVVDNNGDPLIVYHGTRTDDVIGELDPRNVTPGSKYGVGANFTVSRNEAEQYAEHAGGRDPWSENRDFGETPRVFSAYLSISRPFDAKDGVYSLVNEEGELTDFGASLERVLQNKVDADIDLQELIAGDAVVYSEPLKRTGESPHSVEGDKLFDWLATIESDDGSNVALASSLVRALGFDGIKSWADNPFGRGPRDVTHYVPFRADQIWKVDEQPFNHEAPAEPGGIDLLGDDQVATGRQNQVEAERARRDARRSPGIDVPADIDDGLFSARQRQGALFSRPERPSAILRAELRSRHPDIDMDLRTGAEGIVVLDKMAVPEDKRGSGAGTDFLRDLIEQADSRGLTLALTPSADLGGNLPRLRRFYRAHGFVPNRGRNKDFRVQEAMVRPPKTPERAPPTDSAAFRRWFGDSKIVNEDGSPRVVYHQTSTGNVPGIEARGFDVDRIGARGDDEQVPDGIFLKGTPQDIGVGASTQDEVAQIPLYASIQNPFIARDRAELSRWLKFDPNYRELSEDVQSLDASLSNEYDRLEKRFEGRPKRSSDSGEDFFKQADALFERGNAELREAAARARARATEMLREQGYDGVIIENDQGSFGRSTETIVAFEPEQVKSADRNIGTFDPNDPRIQFSSPGTEESGQARQFRDTTAAFDDAAIERKREIERELADALGRVRERIPIDVMTIRPESLFENGEGARGAFLGDRIMLFAGNIPDAAVAREVLRHEAVGHFSMQEMLGDQFRPTLRQVRDLTRRSPSMQALAERVRDRYQGLDPNSDTFQEEMIAVMAEENVKLPVMRRIIAAVRDFLRRLGLLGDITEDELRALISRAGRDLFAQGRALQMRASPATFSAHVPTFYSQMGQVLAEKLPNRGPADQMRQAIEGYAKKGQIKQEELEWSGLQEWLADREGTVEKADILEALAERGVKVEETLRGSEEQTRLERAEQALVDYLVDEAAFSPVGARDYALDAARGDLSEGQRRLLSGRQRELVDELSQAYQARDGKTRPTKYDRPELVLPGGENYRELLLRFPRQGKRDLSESEQAELDALNGRPAAELSESERLRAKELLDAKTGRLDAPEYRAGHFKEEANVLAHVRFNERTDSDGNRVLFLEEIQSDWHQQGRRKGYRTGPPPEPRAYTPSELEISETENQWITQDRDGIRRTVGKGVVDSEQAAREYFYRWLTSLEIERAQEQEIQRSGEAPDAPFKKTWPLLATKRMIRWAADNGFDKVAWTTGEIQVGRYDLSKQVDRVEYNSGTQELRAFQGRDPVIQESGVTEDRLEDYIGKDPAQRLLESKQWDNEAGGATYFIEGDDLKVGGEGMKAFYDQMLPNMVGKYIKKWGSKVADAQVYDESSQTNLSTVHAFDLTPEMREAALQGQPLFSRPPKRGDIRLVGKDADGNTQAAATVKNGEWLIVSKKGDMFGYGIKKARNRQQAEQMIAADGLTVSADIPVQGDTAQADFQPNRLEQPESSYLGEIGRWAQFVAQDRLNSLKRLQETAERQKGERLAEAADPYMMEELYHGRTRERMDEFDEQHVDPLLDAVQRSDYTLEDVDQYLYARHAPEANAKLEEINAGEKAMSGMTNEEAEQILAGLKEQGDFSQLEDIGERVDAMTRATRELLVESGLEKRSTIEAWEKAYEHYVPLKGPPGGGDAASRLPRRGKGFDTRGQASQRRLGRQSRAQNLLANVVASHYSTTQRAEKARVGKALLRFVLENPNEDLWTVDQPMTKRGIDPVTGLVTTMPDPSQRNQDNVLVVRENGVEHHIVFNENNVDAMRIAKTMKNLSADQAGLATRLLLNLNRYLSLMSTSMNPEFVLSNFARDMQTAAINLNDTEASNLKARVMRDAISGKAYRAVRRYQKGRRDSEWARYYGEFLDDGAQTGWMEDYSEIADLQRSLTRKLGQHKPGTWPFAKRQVRNMLEFVGHVNTAVENSARLSAYIHARKAGVSRQRAASLAKNLTVNFNRKGDAGLILNAFYLFYNASIQGGARIVKATKSKKARRFMYAAVAFGIARDIANRWYAGDDEDDENRYDRVPEYVKEMNWVFMLPPNEDMPDWVPGWARGPEGDYIKFPLPYGYNAFDYFGQKMGRAMSAGTGMAGTIPDYSPTQEAVELVLAVFNSFNPIGASPSLLQFFSPTIGDPAVQWAENKNFAGIPLRPEADPYGPPPPNYTLYFSGAREWSRFIAREANMATGGTEVRPGAVNISPELIDHLWDFGTGGAGRFVARTADLPNKLWKAHTGEESIETYEVPFLGKLYGTPRQGASRSLFYDRRRELTYLEQEIDLAKEQRKPERFQELRRQYRGELQMLPMLHATDRILKRIKKHRSRIESADMPEKRQRDLLQKIDDDAEEVYNRFNRRYRRLVVAEQHPDHEGSP